MLLKGETVLSKTDFGGGEKALLNLDGSINVDTNGFVGLVRVGSANFNRHTAARQGKMLIVNGSDRYYSLSDGGLNALPICDTPVCSNTEIGNVTFSPTLFKSSYNNNSTAYGLQYLNVATWTNFYLYGTLAKNTSINNGANVGNIANIKEQANVQVRAYITNSEGTYYSAPISVLLTIPTFSMRFNGTYASWAFQNTNGTITRTIYAESSNLTYGSLVFSNIELDDIPKVGAGFYVKDTTWYEVRAKLGTDNMEVTNLGLCERGSYPAGDPANNYPPPLDITGIFFYTESLFTDYYDSCIFGTTGSSKLYINPTDNKVYQNWVASTNVFSNQFTGFIVINGSCQGRQYTNGTFIKNLTP